MAILNKINVSGTTYDINDERLAENAGTIEASKNLALNGNLTANSIVENMSGYTYYKSTYDSAWNDVYCGVVKTGNKITFVIFGYIEKSADTPAAATLAAITMPSEIGEKLYPYTIDTVSDLLVQNSILFTDTTDLDSNFEGAYLVRKHSNSQLNFSIRGLSQLTNGKTYAFRLECTFLLSDNLIQNA